MGRLKGFKLRGLTLVEMLLVAFIIALLVAVSYLSITAVLESFRQARCIHNLDQIRIAIAMFRADYHRIPVIPEDLYPHYISSKEVFVCPSDPKPRLVNEEKGLWMSYVYHNWGDTPPPKEAEIRDWIPWSEALKIRGEKFPIVVCRHHPDVYIVLRLNGSIEKVSKEWAWKNLKPWWKL